MLRTLLMLVCGFALMTFATKDSSALQSALSEKTFLPDSTGYNSSVSSYLFRQERQLQPDCIVAPTTAQDVSIAIRILAASGTRFAIRGGGHSPNAGAANIHRGVTINLKTLNNIDIQRDGTVTAGAELRWIDLALTLDPHDGALVGGRTVHLQIASPDHCGWAFNHTLPLYQ